MRAFMILTHNVYFRSVRDEHAYIVDVGTIVEVLGAERDSFEVMPVSGNYYSNYINRAFLKEIDKDSRELVELLYG